MFDDDAFVRSMTSLSYLLTAPDDLEATLVRVAHLAVLAVPGAERAALTVLEVDRAPIVVGTDSSVLSVEESQYGLGEGPGVTAVSAGVPCSSGNLGGEPRWPHFGPRTGRLGVHSVLSLPLSARGAVVGALSLYSGQKAAFDESAADHGQQLARLTAVAVANARLLAQTERLVVQLQTALVSRAQIDQALGVVMSRSGVTSAEAFARLRAMSQSRSVKLAEIAQQLLDEAVGRARARHAAVAAAPRPRVGVGAVG